MSNFRLGPAVSYQLDQIYEYTAERWSESQADSYINDLFDYFSDIASKRVAWRAIPAEFGVDGFVGKLEHHFVYWKVLSSGEIGVVAVLHERMHQMARIRELFDN